MAVPKRRTSKARKHARNANWKLEAPGVGECPQCHAIKLNHRVCPSCGQYNGRQVLDVKAAKK